MGNLVLVGGAGGIGRALANRAHANGWKVTVMDLEKSLLKHPPSNGIKSKVIDLKIDMVLVGPEIPLINGIQDYLKKDPLTNKTAVIGPSKKGAELEGSKDFAKNLSQITKLPLTLWDERLSSEGAFKMMSNLDVNTTKKLEKLDENAADFILQGYLDYLNK